MDDAERNALQKCWQLLTSELEFDEIRDYLVQENILSFDQLELIQSERTRSNQIVRFLSILIKTNLKLTFPVFLRILEDIDKHYVKDRIQNVYDNGKVLQPGATSMTLPKHGFMLQILIEPYDSKYQCSSCELLLRAPIQSFCGHRFCKLCLEDLKNQGIQICPACENEGTVDEDVSNLNIQTIPDHGVKRDMSKLRAKCVNNGCPWQGILKEYEAHESTCEFRDVACPECGTRVPRDQLDDHLEKCPQRRISCPHCRASILQADKDVHNKDCPQYPVMCDACGKKDVLRSKLSEHQDPDKGDCVGHILSCPYGCDDLIPGEKMVQHLQKRAGDHLDIVLERVINLEETTKHLQEKITAPAASPIADNIKIELQQVKQHVLKLEESRQKSDASPVPSGGGASVNPVLVAHTQTLDRKMETCAKLVTVLHREHDQMQQTLNRYEEHMRLDGETIQTLQRKLQSLERVVAIKDVTIAEMGLRVEALEMTSRDGTLVWPITEFSTKRQDAISGKTPSLYSPFFFTSWAGEEFS